MTDRFAIVDNGLVINVVVADPGYAEQQGWIECEHGGPGWLYLNGVFSPQPVNLDELRNGRKAEVMRLRDSRIDGGITFNGYEFQTKQADRENVAGAAQLATLWLMNNGDPTSLRWADSDSDFMWIDLQNELRPMSAIDIIDFGRALATMKRQCIFRALDLKQMIDAASTEEEIREVDITTGWP